MELSVHASGAGLIVFTAADAAPPRDALRVLGPLQHRGRMRIPDRAAQGAWREIVGQVERHLFAAVGESDAALLMGASHPCLVARETTPGPED
jgi:hypothetical protein